MTKVISNKEITKEEIAVKPFVGADAPVLLSIMSDLLMALYLNPIYRIEDRNVKDAKDFLVKTVTENAVENIIQDIMLYTSIDPDVIKVIVSFAANIKTGVEYKNVEQTMSLDDTLLVISVVLEKFLTQFTKTSFFLSLQSKQTSSPITQKSVNIEK